MDTQSSVSEVESDTSSTSCSATPAPSLLDRLKAPQKSQLARKRAIKTNSGRFYKTHTIPSTKNDPKNVSPAERVSDEPFIVSAGKLFCFACQEEVGLKKSVIDKHVASAKKHQAAKLRLKDKQQRETDIAQAFREYAAQEHAVDETLSESQQVYRVNVVSTFLRAGVPVSKIEVFRPLLEDTAYCLAGRRTMSDVIPFIHQEEIKRIKS